MAESPVCLHRTLNEKGAAVASEVGDKQADPDKYRCAMLGCLAYAKVLDGNRAGRFGNCSYPGTPYSYWPTSMPYPTETNIFATKKIEDVSTPDGMF